MFLLGLKINQQQEKMGVVQSCCDKTHQKGYQSHLLKTQLSATTKQAPNTKERYKLTPEAEATYLVLKAQYNNNEFLNIKTDIESSPEFNYLEDYRQLYDYNAFYRGEWRDHLPHGKGIAIFQDGSGVLGTFNRGYCIGKENYFLFLDGSYYVGSIIKNRLEGKGKLISSAAQYEGEWLNNIPHGQGIQRFKNGDRYIGTFQFGRKHGNDSLFIWGDHEIYSQFKGSFKSGKIHGQGTLILKNKIVVQGLFDEQQIKKGILNSPKYKYTGNFKKGKLSGAGKLQILEYHQCLDGSFKEGQLYGCCKIKDERERISEAFFFKCFKLKKSVGFSDEELDNILGIVKHSYEIASKHSEVITQLSQELGQYDCKFIQPFEHLFIRDKYLIIEIFEKALLIKSKKIQ